MINTDSVWLSGQELTTTVHILWEKKQRKKRLFSCVVPLDFIPSVCSAQMAPTCPPPRPCLSICLSVSVCGDRGLLLPLFAHCQISVPGMWTLVTEGYEYHFLLGTPCLNLLAVVMINTHDRKQVGE